MTKEHRRTYFVPFKFELEPNDIVLINKEPRQVFIQFKKDIGRDVNCCKLIDIQRNGCIIEPLHNTISGKFLYRYLKNNENNKLVMLKSFSCDGNKNHIKFARFFLDLEV